MHPYARGVIDKITKALETQEDKLKQASDHLAENVENGGVLYILGSGHSHMIAEEIFYRAGGPIFVSPILDPGLMLHNGAKKSTRLERLPGYAEAILKDIDFQDHDIFLVISNSGRNIVPVEAAYYAKNKGIFTMSISSFAHSESVDSRHPSGKKLFNLTNIALDNCGEIGDAQLKIAGESERYGASSSAVGIVLVQTLVSMTIEKLVQKGVKPPLIRSANLDGSDEQNEELMKKYRARIPLLR